MTVKARAINDRPTIELTLPYDVAVTLRALTDHVGGTPRSYREDMREIQEALISAGISYKSGRFSTSSAIYAEERNNG